MKTTKLFCIGLFLCAIFNLNAQFFVGPKVGLNISNFIGEDVEDSKMKLGPQIGCVFDIPAGKVFSFQPGFLYSNKGASFEGAEDNLTFDFWYLDLPLNAVVNMDAGNGKLQVYAGPNIGMCFYSKLKIGDESERLSVQSIDNMNGGDVKLFSLGVNAGLGYRINNVQVQAGYGLSFGELFRDDDSNLQHSVISLTLAYLFKVGK